MKYSFFYILLVVFFLASCTQQNQVLDKSLEARIEILYDHSLLMVEYSTDVQLNAIGMDPKPLMKHDSITTQKMIEQMEASFGIQGQGNYEQRLIALENKMNRMMEEWARTT